MNNSRSVMVFFCTVYHNGLWKDNKLVTFVRAAKAYVQMKRIGISWNGVVWRRCFINEMAFASVVRERALQRACDFENLMEIEQRATMSIHLAKISWV